MTELICAPIYLGNGLFKDKKLSIYETSNRQTPYLI